MLCNDPFSQYLSGQCCSLRAVGGSGLLEDNVQALQAPYESVVLDNIGMVEVFEQINLHFHILQVCDAQILEADLLDGHGLARAPIQGPIDATKGALAQTVAQLEILEPSDILRRPLCSALSARPLFSLTGLAAVVRGR